MTTFHDRVPLKAITNAARRALSEAYVRRQKAQGRGAPDVRDLILVTTVPLPDGGLAGLSITATCCDNESEAILLGESLFSSTKRGIDGWRAARKKWKEKRDAGL